jgi:hypothetical protein
MELVTSDFISLISDTPCITVPDYLSGMSLRSDITLPLPLSSKSLCMRASFSGGI